MDKILQAAQKMFEAVSKEDVHPQDQRTVLRIAIELLDLRDDAAFRERNP